MAKNRGAQLYALPLSSFPGRKNKEDTHTNTAEHANTTKDGEEWAKRTDTKYIIYVWRMAAVCQSFQHSAFTHLHFRYFLIPGQKRDYRGCSLRADASLRQRKLEQGRAGEVGGSAVAPSFSSLSPIRQGPELPPSVFFPSSCPLLPAADESAPRRPSVHRLPPKISHTTATVIQFISPCPRCSGAAGPWAPWA